MSVRRFDRGSYRKPVRTPEGFLKVDGLLSRVGVFTYVRPDGQTVREFRPPEEVFDPEALASFELVPVTDEHPPEFVDAKNVQRFHAGAVGTGIRQDGDFVFAPLAIQLGSLVEKIERGEARELSCGYSCDLEEKPGEWMGEPYDVIQRKIRGNHVAVVPVGRAGPEARLRMDAQDASMVGPDPSRGGRTQEQNVSTRKKKIDGVEYEIPEQAAQAVEKLERAHSDALSAKETQIAELQKKLDEETKAKAAAQAKADAAGEELKKKEDALKAAQDPKALKTRIAERSKLLTLAGKLVASKKLDGLSDEEIKLAALKADRPKHDWEKAEPAYVAAAWDLLAEKLEKKADAGEDDDDDASRARKVADAADDEGDEDDDDEEEDDSDDDDDQDDDDDEEDRGGKRTDAVEAKARKKFLKSSANAYKRPLGRAEE